MSSFLPAMATEGQQRRRGRRNQFIWAADRGSGDMQPPPQRPRRFALKRTERKLQNAFHRPNNRGRDRCLQRGGSLRFFFCVVAKNIVVGGIAIPFLRTWGEWRRKTKKHCCFPRPLQPLSSAEDNWPKRRKKKEGKWNDDR